jgi:methyltransferase (TIGR00027 family)
MQPAGRRLLDDPFSRHFAGRYKPLLLTALTARAGIALLDSHFGGLHAHVVLRARYTDDVRQRAVADGIDQLAIIGAGFDTTCLRTPPNSTLTIFEVDAPTTQSIKRWIIERAGLPVGGGDIRWVAVDFEREELREQLSRSGFDPHRRCLIVWLGVSFYLTPPAFHRTLAALGELCAPGSLLIVDYGDPELVTGSHRLRSARRATRAVRGRGEPYATGLTDDELAAALGEHGFAVRDRARVPDLVKRYAAAQPSRYSTDDWLGIVTAERRSEAA